MMSFVIVQRSTQLRIKDTPVFDYPMQAKKYVEKVLHDSPYVTVKKVFDKKNNNGGM